MNCHFLILLFLSLPALVSAADFRGRFVINPLDNQAWFVRADNKKILTGNSAFALFKLRSLAQVINDRDWALIASSASTPLSTGNSTPLVTSTTSTLAMKLQGKILHKASDNSLWYLDPSDRSLASLATPLAFNLLLARSAARPGSGGRCRRPRSPRSRSAGPCCASSLSPQQAPRGAGR